MKIKERGRVAEERSPKLPDDLITEIISRVPAKDLMRFMCVSKSWCSLISTDSYFSTLQLQRTASLHRPFSVVLVKEAYYDSDSDSDYEYGDYYFSFWIDLDSVVDQDSDVREIPDQLYDFEDRDVIASCHGLLVLLQKSGFKMTVANPTTKKYHIVPPNPAGEASVFFCGFGYDHVHSSYKLVTQIGLTPTYDESLELMVYDVNQGMWKRLQFGTWLSSVIDGLDHNYNKDYSPWYYSEKICVDGVVYWFPRIISGNWVTKNMICFILAEEEFHVVETPDFCDALFYQRITDFEGRLCLAGRGANNKTAEFWMIDMEYKESESAYSWGWTKFFTILDPFVALPPGLKNTALAPVCFSACKNKILFLVDGLKLFWYEVASKEFWPWDKGSSECSYEAWYCVRSLVGNGIF